MTQTFEIPWHRLDAARPPVVLMGGLNVMRCLGMAGIQAIVASSDPSEPAFASRYCIGRCHLPPLAPPGAAVDVLVALGEALQRRFDVRIPLMYGSDDALELVHDFRDRLGAHFAFLMSDPEVTAALIAKDRFHAFCESRGLVVPALLDWDGEGPGSLRAASGEVLVKPKLKRNWHCSRIARLLFGGTGKARIFRNCGEVLRHPQVVRFRRHLLFQEYVPGGEGDLWSFHGFADERGELLASFVGRKLRTFPAETGESAFIELMHDEALSAIGRAVAARCALRGVFKIDFKRDPRDGRSYLLEINARFNLWHYLGAVNGMNIPAMVYDYLVFGAPPRHTHYATRMRWLSWPFDVRAFREMSLLGRLRPLPWLRSILSFRIVYSVFDWKDPGPWLLTLSQRFKRLLLRIETFFRWPSSAS